MGGYSKSQAAQTCLNLNYVLSKLGRHQEALTNSLKAIELLKEEISDCEHQMLEARQKGLTAVKEEVEKEELSEGE